MTYKSIYYFRIKTGALEGTLAYLNEVISQFSKIEWAKISSGEISKPLILSGGDPVVHSSSEHTALLHVLNNYTSSLFDSNSSYSILFEYIVVIIFLLMLICTFWLLKVNDKHDDKRAIAFNQKYIQKTENIDVQMALIMKQIIKRVRILRQSDVLMDGYE